VQQIKSHILCPVVKHYAANSTTTTKDCNPRIPNPGIPAVLPMASQSWDFGVTKFSYNCIFLRVK